MTGVEIFTTRATSLDIACLSAPNYMRDFGKADKQDLWWPSYLDDGQEHLATTTTAHLAPLVGSEGLPSISAVPKVESPTI
jgi:hypothetical protein